MSKDNKNVIDSDKLGDSDNLRVRVLQAKTRLPKNMDYVPMYEHDCGRDLKEQEKSKLRRTWNLRDMDEKYVAWFERMADKLKAE